MQYKLTANKVTRLKLSLLVVSMFLFINVFGNAKISGDLTERTTVTEIAIFLPVDIYTNDDMETRYPVVNHKFSIDLDIKQPLFVKILIGARKIYFLVKPGDDIRFKYFDSGSIDNIIKFNGSNAPGQRWYNVYTYQPLNNFIGNGQLLDAISTGSLNQSLHLLGLYVYKEGLSLDSLYRTRQVDKVFWTLAKTDLRSMHVLNMIRRITYLLDRISDKKLVAKYKNIVKILNRLAGPEDILNARSYFGKMFLGNYYSDSLFTVSNSDKEEVYHLGPYTGYQYAPNTLKQFLIGDILLFQQVTGTEEYDFKKAFNQYKKEFQKSPYITLINQLNKPTGAVGINIILDTVTNYNSIDDIKQHFKGKAVYIDLWATWCIPCRAEFGYYKSLMPMMKQKNIQPVFISIDAPAAKVSWEKLVLMNNLKGTHILAKSKLKADIVKLVYKNGQISVPRYLVINNKGKVVNWNAPRPSDAALVKAINKL